MAEPTEGIGVVGVVGLVVLLLVLFGAATYYPTLGASLALPFSVMALAIAVLALQRGR